MRRFIVLISVIMLSSAIWTAIAQPDDVFKNEGDKAKFSVMIEFEKAYISGIGIMARQNDKIVCSVFNEFGVSVLSFAYDLRKGKTKLLGTIGFINKWYIKRVLKQDISKMMANIEPLGVTYRNEKRKITYSFTPLIEQDEITE